MSHPARAGALVLLIIPFLGLVACGGPGFDKPMQIGGRLLQPETLNRGRDLYNRFCATCHGYDGKADTAQARQLDPRPRDLTHADFKRVATPGALPSDSELSVLIQNGIPGTGMPAWPQLQGDDLDAVVQYLKTFSQRWNSEVTPAPKKSEQGSMNVLPARIDAASFRAASRATPVKGHPNESALADNGQHLGPTGMDSRDLETEPPSPEDEGVGAIAARTPPIQPPQVAR